MSVCPSIRLSVCPSVRLYVCSSVCLSVYPSVRLSVYPFIRLLVCLSVYPSVCLSVYPSARLSVCLSVYPSVQLSVLFFHALVAVLSSSILFRMCLNSYVQQILLYFSNHLGTFLLKSIIAREILVYHSVGYFWNNNVLYLGLASVKEQVHDMGVSGRPRMGV